MATMNKTPKGTISAFRFSNGIACGIYGEGNFISLEYDEKECKLKVLLIEEEMKNQGFELIYVDNKWKEIKK